MRYQFADRDGLITEADEYYLVRCANFRDPIGPPRGAERADQLSVGITKRFVKSAMRHRNTYLLGRLFGIIPVELPRITSAHRGLKRPMRVEQDSQADDSNRKISLDESRQQLDRPFAAGPRFVVVMLAGIAALVTGLGMVSQVVNPPLALLLIVAGVFAVQVEPALLQIQESVARLVTAQSQGPDAVTAAEERLRYAHLWLVTANFTILLAVVLTLLAF